MFGRSSKAFAYIRKHLFFAGWKLISQMQEAYMQAQQEYGEFSGVQYDSSDQEDATSELLVVISDLIKPGGNFGPIVGFKVIDDGKIIAGALDGQNYNKIIGAILRNSNRFDQGANKQKLESFVDELKKYLEKAQNLDIEIKPNDIKSTISELTETLKLNSDAAKQALDHAKHKVWLANAPIVFAGFVGALYALKKHVIDPVTEDLFTSTNAESDLAQEPLDANTCRKDAELVDWVKKQNSINGFQIILINDGVHFSYLKHLGERGFTCIEMNKVHLKEGGYFPQSVVDECRLSGEGYDASDNSGWF